MLELVESTLEQLEAYQDAGRGTDGPELAEAVDALHRLLDRLAGAPAPAEPD